MFEPLSDSMRKIARGTGIAMLGMLVGLLLQFVARLIIARYGLANYGIFSLALVVFTWARLIACLGLHQGVTRYIAYFQARGDAAKVRGTISASLQLATVASIIMCIAIFFSAEAIALNIFHSSDLVPALKIFAVGIPFFTLMVVLVSFFRGLGQVKPQVYFQSIMLNFFFLLFLSALILLNFSFIAVFYAYLAAIVLMFVGSLVYTAKKLPQPVRFTNIRGGQSLKKELLAFSLPLLGTAVLSLIITWTDTLMLGYFKTLEVVGLYNAAYPLAYFISMPLAALLLIYIPIATGLYSQNLMAELRRNYTILTKWLSSLTLPIFLVLCLFPEAALNLFFGSAYIAAAPALRILSLGFIIHNLLGPNGATLIALGKPRFIMWVTLSAAAINVILNIALIPPLGIVGAAIASAAALTLSGIIALIKLYSLCQAQPLSKNLLKPLIASVVLAFLFQFTVGSFLTVTWWMLPLLFILYYAIYGIAIVLTRSFDQEDIAMLLEIEKRSGINAAPIKKILSRFVKL